MLMSDESAGGPHAAPMAVTPPASLSAPEAWGGGAGRILKREKPPFRGGEKRNECLWLKEQLQRVADFILAATWKGESE